ncbi:unnamed protein product [Phytomonas sp. Hart1]|nr:unnamed protein product [Phytomonas sp. Hart1]|eukprot:CCW65961.1 unnamed protein product [Phytomonas sp. isolate Hart1]
MTEAKTNVPIDEHEESAYPNVQALFPGIHRDENGTPYYSAGGGEIYYSGTPFGMLQSIFDFLIEENKRVDYSSSAFVGLDAHTRSPLWMEHKNTHIDGTIVPDESIAADPKHWRTKYRKELDIAEAIEEARKQARFESKNDFFAVWGWVRRRFNFSTPPEGAQPTVKVEAPPSAETKKELPLGVLVEKSTGSEGSVWRALMHSVESGKPLAKAAKEYRPRISFYGLDPFLDSSYSLIWFSVKCGVGIGLLQGTMRAVQTIDADIAFLKASGLGVLSILNMSVFAGVVKWSGNMGVLAAAFCIGDRLARGVKRRLLPSHDAERRSQFNYMVGLALSGSTVGIMPWWILNDVKLAGRLAISGAFLGGVLGMGVGLVIQRLVALNISKLDATNRQLRCYEAFIMRQHKWLEQEYQKHKYENAVWW